MPEIAGCSSLRWSIEDTYLLNFRNVHRANARCCTLLSYSSGQLRRACIPAQESYASPFQEKHSYTGSGQESGYVTYISFIYIITSETDRPDAMMQFGGKKKAKLVSTVIPEPSYNIPLVLGGTSTTIKALSQCAQCAAMCRPSSSRLWS